MSTLRTNTLQTLDSAVTINIADVATATSVTAVRNDLANTADLTKGIALVGRSMLLFKSVTELLTTVGRVDGDVASLTQYRTTVPRDGAGFLRWDSASTATPDLGQVFQVTGVPTGRWFRVLTGPASILDWGAYRDGTNAASNNTALQSARDYVAASGNQLNFPSGTYGYSVSPNWAIANSTIRAQGIVYMQYSGTGQGLILDGGAVGVGLFCQTMTGFIVRAPATATDAIYIRAMHHCDYGLRADGAGPTSSGIRIEFAVCTMFRKPEVSNNSSSGWYLGAKPQFGLNLNQRGAGEQVAYCTFENPVLEGVTTGSQLNFALGNTFNGGTMEGCTSVGAVLGAGALRNKFNKVDFEANTTADISVTGGNENEFNSCDTSTLVFIGSGNFNRVIGGSHKTIDVEAAANGTLLSNFLYNRANDGGVLTDLGNRTHMESLTYGPTTLQHDAKPVTTAVTIGASPTTYLNTTGNKQVLYINGGTISAISLTPSGGGPNAVGVGTAILMCPQDSVTITYSVAPTAYTNSR